ncbi:restriction endonuclease subunit S [Streptococcus mitis]|uniref:restriction endonuclease subunit S n=1 Tax=Streptococcus mitis TaxID=28037 RepID=UPI001C4FC2E2
MTKQPSYRFAGYTEVWEEKKLGEVSTSFSGGTPAAGNKKYYGGEIPFIRSAEINSDTTELFLTKEGLDNSSAKLVKEGDILYALYGATSGEVGISKINGAINQAILSIIPKNNYTSEFIMQWLRLQKKNITDKYLQGGQGNLSGSIVKELAIFFPSLPEQTAIGSFFQDIDQLISLQQRKLEVLKEQKKTYLKLLFSAKGQIKPALRFAGFENDWKEVKLGEVCSIKGGNAWKSEHYSTDGKYLVVTISNVKGNEYIDDTYGNRIDTVESQFILEQGDILISLTGNVGRVSKMTEVAAVLNQRVGKLATNQSNNFLFTLLSNRNFEKEMVLSSQGAAQANISNNDVLNYKTSFPSLPEQEAIGSFFQDLDKSIAKQEEKVNQLKESKQTLLRKMFI